MISVQNSNKKKAFYKTKMKVFQTLQKQYEILGLSSSNQSTSFSKRVFFVFSLYAYLLASQFVYIYHVASGFMGYMECICATLSSIIMFVCFAAVAFRRSIFFNTIDNIENLIETSKSILNTYL